MYNSINPVNSNNSGDTEESAKQQSGEIRSDDVSRVSSDGDASVSLSQSSLIHTKITAQDNPFAEDKEPAVETIMHKKQLVNPNKNYQGQSNGDEEEDEDENLQVARKYANDRTDVYSHNDSSAGSINVSPDTRSQHDQDHHSPDKVYILEASKVSEGQGRTYIAYTIKFGNSMVRRRYSEFESLRKILVKLFPMTLIPPIPEKQSITSYGKSIAGSKSSYLLPSEAAGSVDLSLSVINGSVNTNDEKLIRHRIRMLTSFLNRLLKNKEITKTSIITDFLDPNNTNWNDVITSSATISSLPKSVLQCNPLDPTNTTRAHTFLPVPSSSTQLLLNKETLTPVSGEDEDDGFTKIEQEYKQYEQILNAGFYKYNKRITKNLFALKQDMKELSEAFAEFSNDQKRGAELAEHLSHLSNTFDESASELESIVGKLYYNINEPLSESVHMAGAARELLKYRKLKVIQKDILSRTLLYKRAQLKKLQEQETEAKKIDTLVDQELSKSAHINLKNPESKTYSGKLFNKINKIASMVKDTVSYQDPDPSTAIDSLQKDIQQLTESLSVSVSDLKVISSTIKDVELPSFSGDRNKEISDILKNYSKYLKFYAQNNLKIWQEVKSCQGM